MRHPCRNRFGGTNACGGKKTWGGSWNAGHDTASDVMEMRHMPRAAISCATADLGLLEQASCFLKCGRAGTDQPQGGLFSATEL